MKKVTFLHWGPWEAMKKAQNLFYRNRALYARKTLYMIGKTKSLTVFYIP
jgi:hypothetical protein